MQIQRHEIFEIRIDSANFRYGSFQQACGRIVFTELQDIPQALDKGQVKNIAAVRLATALHELDGLAIQFAAELKEQTAFARSRLADDGNELAFAATGLFKTILQCLQFLLSPR